MWYNSSPAMSLAWHGGRAPEQQLPGELADMVQEQFSVNGAGSAMVPADAGDDITEASSTPRLLRHRNLWKF